MNDKEFRQHLAELLARQRNPGQPAKKNPPTPELPPKPATISNKEFRKHLKQLVARQGNAGQPPVEKKPPKSEPSKLATPVPPARKPPASVNTTRTFNVRRKSR